MGSDAAMMVLYDLNRYLEYSPSFFCPAAGVLDFHLHKCRNRPDLAPTNPDLSLQSTHSFC